jgi:thymidylate synthase (FAD)
MTPNIISNYEGKGALALDVLDHGFVALRNISGPNRRPNALFDADDIDPAQAARISFNQMDSNRSRDADIKLADYLMRNWHTSPFEMVEIWLEMKMPIFVARQFVRHRTASINEISGRYVQLPAEWYVPEVVGGKSADKKQGQEDNLDTATQTWFKLCLNNQCRASYNLYQKALDRGVATEHARILLHLNHYTHWLWKQDLHNMLNFLRLRDHNHAQIEAQRYAQAIDQLLRQYLPNNMSLYDKYRRFGG